MPLSIRITVVLFYPVMKMLVVKGRLLVGVIPFCLPRRQKKGINANTLVSWIGRVNAIRRIWVIRELEVACDGVFDLKSDLKFSVFRYLMIGIIRRVGGYVCNP